MKIRIYDNGGKTFDRYTVVFIDRPERKVNHFECLGMSDNPFHPQGFGQHSTAVPGRHLGKRIKFDELPFPCQKLVHQNIGADIPM